MPVRLPEQTLNDPVTQHMRRDVTRLQSDLTVAQALTWVREHPPAERIIYFYVVDNDDCLVGVVPTRRLILATPERPLTEIMVQNVVVVPSQATVLEACEFFIQ